MESANTWSDYMSHIAPRATDAQIATAIGVSPSTVSRWRSGQVDPKPRQVVAFARAFGVNPLGALIAADYLDTTSLSEPINLPIDLSATPTAILLDEVSRRVELLEAGMSPKAAAMAIRDYYASHGKGGDAEATVHQLPVREPRREVANDTLPEHTQRPDGEYE